MQTIPEVELIAAVGLGWLMQKARSYKGVNNWLVWIGVSLVAAVGWVWATPDALAAFTTNWRTALVAIVMFASSAGGFGKLSKDAKMAPAADTK